MPGIEIFLLIANGPKGLFNADGSFFKIHEGQKLDGLLILSNKPRVCRSMTTSASSSSNFFIVFYGIPG
ncbi:MAG: hypothetical protein L6300_17260, partial [Syntrophaceae bacterium]|nr:hypothetical protein [Syntrophaceae bacterium]